MIQFTSVCGFNVDVWVLPSAVDGFVMSIMLISKHFMPSSESSYSWNWINGCKPGFVGSIFTILMTISSKESVCASSESSYSTNSVVWSFFILSSSVWSVLFTCFLFLHALQSCGGYALWQVYHLFLPWRLVASCAWLVSGVTCFVVCLGFYCGLS